MFSSPMQCIVSSTGPLLQLAIQLAVLDDLFISTETMATLHVLQLTLLAPCVHAFFVYSYSLTCVYTRCSYARLRQSHVGQF